MYKRQELKSLDSSSGSSQLPVQKVVHYREKISEHHHSESLSVPPKMETKSKAPIETRETKVENIVQKKESAQIITEKPKKVVSPEKLWHALIVEMDTEHINKPQLKFWMQEAKPLSVENDVLTVCFDEEFNTLHSRRIFEEKALLEKCMHRLTGINNLKLNVKLVKGLISPPVMQKTKDLDEVKEKILNNEFVQKTLEIFDGTLVDFRG